MVVELKAVEGLLPVHQAQVLTYLKLSGYRLGLLINFNVPVLKDGQLEGIFSERDIMKRVLVEGLDPAKTSVADVMTRNPLVVSPDDKIEHCLMVMKQHGFRHLPVCNGRKLEGFLSLRDLLLHEVNEKDGEVRMMREYMHATPGQG